MKITTVSLTEDTIKFLLEGVDTAFANTLRRAMVAEVPTMTIDDIFYFDNSSIVPDEIVAHRIGLIPIKTDLDTYILPQDCDCAAELGCPKCRAVLTLDIEAKDDTVTVYSGDLIPEDPETVPSNPIIPIAKLAPKQALRFEAYAQLGKGKEHTKWSPVSVCVYQNTSVVNIKEKSKVQECIKYCGKEAAMLIGSKLKIIDVQKFEACPLCVELVSHETIIENLIEDEFLFKVESTGALPPQRIVSEAAKVMKIKIAEMINKIDTDEIHDSISDFETPEMEAGKLYSIGSSDYDEDEEDESVE
jgi:DNA-directed RNA polymerase subunit D